MRWAVDQILVVDMVGGQRAQGDANRRAVLLLALLSNVQIGWRVQAQLGCFNNLRLVGTGGLGVKNNGGHGFPYKRTLSRTVLFTSTE